MAHFLSGDTKNLIKNQKPSLTLSHELQLNNKIETRTGVIRRQDKTDGFLGLKVSQ